MPANQQVDQVRNLLLSPTFKYLTGKKKKKIQKSTLNVPLSCIKEFLRTGKTEHSIIAAAAGEKKKYQNCL